MRVTRRSLAAAVAVLATVLSGCSPVDPLRPEGLVGQSLQVLDQRVGERDDMTQLTQDASLAVGQEPTLTGNDLDSAAWTVVAACADADDVNAATVLEVAVIPTETYTASVAEQVAAGGFDDTVSCIFDT